MELMKQLSQYFLDTKLVSREQMDSWMEGGTIEHVGNETEFGFELCRCRYQAIFSFERFNQPPATLFAMVTGWLQTNDSLRGELELSEPDIDIDINDDNVADVQLSIEFIEPVYLVEDPINGIIEAYGKKWAFDAYALSVAETLTGIQT